MRRVAIGLFAVLGALFAVRWLGAEWCARDAERWWTGDHERQLALARGVKRWLDRSLEPERFGTGSERFDGEWLFGTYVMAAIGLSQIALQQPAQVDALRPQIERAIDGALSERARAFDRAAWSDDPLASLGGEPPVPPGGFPPVIGAASEHPKGWGSAASPAHAAYLGYLGVALGLERQLRPEGPHAALHDRVSEALARRLAASRALLLETYPGEVYPVDNASVIATLSLHARAHGQPRPPIVDRWLSECRRRWIERKTGLLVQAVDIDGAPRDAARGSGTALASYFLAHADLELSRDLHRALERQLGERVLGFGVVREYPSDRFGDGDIDSGPLVFGYSISATGFSLAGCRIHGDARCFRERYATFDLLGAPLAADGTWSFVSGGPLGDAILLAMLTARGGVS